MIFVFVENTRLQSVKQIFTLFTGNGPVDSNFAW